MQRKPENDLVFLLMILESVGKIDKYRSEFTDALGFYKANDQLNFNASLLLLANIGELANKISEETKVRNSDVAWVKLKGLRNRIVHDYSGIDFEMTFEIIDVELPELRTQLEKLIGENLNKGIIDRTELDVAWKSSFYSHVDFNKIITWALGTHFS